MSENKKSFWSSIPGLVTGLAGLLTGIVGLVTVLIQLDVIGGGDDSAEAPAAGVTTTAVVTGPGGAPATGGGPTTTTLPRVTVNPTSLRLAPTEREKTVTVRNESATATVTMLKPEFDGADRAQFSTDTGCTNTRLAPGRTCTLKVLFAPSGPLKTYSASLVLTTDANPLPTEVRVEATTLLGG